MASESNKTIRVGLVGGTGYTGSELLRLLVGHPNITVEVITSRQEAGNAVADLHPQLRGHIDLAFTDPARAPLSGCDVVFFATPHATAMNLVPDLLDAGIRVIDLSADFRLRDSAIWADWYGQAHACPQLIDEAVYGLPEINRASITDARLVASPGCYPTAVLLGLLPLLESGTVALEGLVADAKTGVSGAGRTLKTPFLFGEMAESFKAYGVAGHRHLPEIQQEVEHAAGAPVGLTFVPHLVPMTRGIHATLYARTIGGDGDLQHLFEQRYADEPFVDVLPAGSTPETRSVRGANDCRIAVHRPAGGDTAVVHAVVDNLVKGAAGQGVQCFNLMHGLDESAGLLGPALLP